MNPFGAPTWAGYLPATRHDIWALWDYVLAQTETCTLSFDELRRHMSAIDDLINRLGAATDEIAAELTALRDEVAGSDTATAAKFEPLIARLEALGADPTNPVPAPEPPAA